MQDVLDQYNSKAKLVVTAWLDRRSDLQGLQRVIDAVQRGSPQLVLHSIQLYEWWTDPAWEDLDTRMVWVFGLAYLLIHVSPIPSWSSG